VARDALRVRGDLPTVRITLVLAASALYLPVSIWHFAAHASGSDPSVAHVLLAIGDVTILSGVAWVFTAWLTYRRRPTPSG
jgi:hypothetical protein